MLAWRSVRLEAVISLSRHSVPATYCSRVVPTNMSELLTEPLVTLPEPSVAAVPSSISSSAQVREERARFRGVGRFYQPELDALRFFAFLAVFAHHAVGKSAPLVSSVGAFGLSLFFFLSAYLITELLQREKEGTGTIALRAFYVRRTLRIWPLYLGFLAVNYLLGHGFAGHSVHALQVPGGLFLCFIFFVGNFYAGANGFTEAPVSPLWSISIEEQFYLCWPLANKLLGRRMLITLAVGMIPVGMLATVWLVHQGATPAVGIWASTLVEFEFFSCGALLSLLLHGKIPQLGGFARTACVLMGAACWLAASRWAQVEAGVAGSPFKLIAGYLLVAAGCIVLLLSLLGLRASLIPNSFIYLGKISYGLYVFHQLSLLASVYLLHRAGQAALDQTHHGVYSLLRLSLALTLTVGLAALSYRFFESPFLRLKARFEVVRTRTI